MTLSEMLMHLEQQTALPEIALGLERVRDALGQLGNPEARVPPVVHVAGTNGKGSTLSFLKTIYEAAGYRVHRYTSPHLVRFHERIVLAGQEIDDATLTSALARVLAVIERGTPLTYFEATTLAAFVAFSETPADVLLLEVGMGGALDATNIIARPALCIITPVAMDHKEFLGNDIASIAREKSGILKPSVPAIIAPQLPEAMQAIEAMAAQTGAVCHRYGQEWRMDKIVDGFRVSSSYGNHVFPPPAMVGEHQFINAAVAAQAALTLGLPEVAICKGMTEAYWPGRLQRLRHGPLCEAMEGQGALWLDGGHNAHAAAALRQWLDSAPMPTSLIVGMMQRKDAQEFFSAFRDWSGELIAVPIDQPAAAPPESLVLAAKQAGMANVCAAQNLASAVRIARQNGSQRLLLCGSLYLAGQVLKTHT